MTNRLRLQDKNSDFTDIYCSFIYQSICFYHNIGHWFNYNLNCIICKYFLRILIRFFIITIAAADARQRVLCHSLLHTFIADVSIDLSRIELLVTENIFKHAHIHISALIHKRCGCMAKLMHRIVLGSESRKIEIFIHQPLNGLDAYSLISAT